jgi:hypothetical protein
MDSQQNISHIVEQITTLWVEPEVKRRDFKEKIFAVLILFEENEKPKVFFNFECLFKVTIDPSIGGPFTPGQDVTFEDLAKRKITNITIPEDFFSKYAFIAAVTINGRWFVKWNALYNKNEAKKRLAKAENFLKAAIITTDNAVKSYNLFHALEQAVHSYFMFRPGMKAKIQSSRKHKTIQKDLNLDTKLGNFPTELKDLFNKLLPKRRAIYDESVIVAVSESDIKNVENFIRDLKRRTEQD